MSPRDTASGVNAEILVALGLEACATDAPSLAGRELIGRQQRRTQASLRDAGRGAVPTPALKRRATLSGRSATGTGAIRGPAALTGQALRRTNSERWAAGASAGRPEQLQKNSIRLTFSTCFSPARAL